MMKIALNYFEHSRTLKPVAMAALVLVVSACGSSDSGGSSGASLGTGPLAGVWERCLGGFKTTYTFTDSRWVENKQLYQQVDCSGAPLADSGFGDLVFEGTYSLLGPSISESGVDVQLINMSSDKLNGTAVLESARVTQYNIVYTGMAGQLIFGDFNQGTEANRPTRLEFDTPFIRR